jgi:hypothetical protein
MYVAILPLDWQCCARREMRRGKEELEVESKVDSWGDVQRLEGEVFSWEGN